MEAIIRNNKTGNVIIAKAEAYNNTRTGKPMFSGHSLCTIKEVYWQAKNCTVLQEDKVRYIG
jgi:hypothetical protein